MRAELLLRSLGISLGLTLLLEFLFARMLGVRDRRDYVPILLVNVLTNPPVVLLCTLFPSPYLTALLELAAVFTEGGIYRLSTSFRHPLLFSLGANAFSYGAGLALQALMRYIF